MSEELTREELELAEAGEEMLEAEEATLGGIYRDIDAITAEINFFKRQAAESIYEIGTRLIEAKTQLNHGEWLPWLRSEVEFSEASAQRYMQLAREYGKTRTVRDLGVSKALQLLALPAFERDEFLAEKHPVNGEEKTVSEMSRKELQQVIKERDEARKKAEAAESAEAEAMAEIEKMRAEIDDLEVDSIKNFIYADDLYITYITYIKNIRVVCLNFNYGKDIQGIKTILPLYQKNVHGHKNNEYIEKINSLLFRDSKKLKYYTEKTITDDTLIVSFTSYPPRIRFCYQVIRSLLDQSLDKSLYHIILVLAVPNFPNKEKDLPVSLVELVNSTNQVQIIWYDRDIMSHKKLIPTLKEFPNNPILVTDDDIERPYDWLQTFYKDHKKYPNDIIIGASFYFLDIFQQFKETSIQQAHIEHNKTAGMVYNFARPANGAGGTLYPPHTFITKEFYDEDLMMKISPTSDEMWQYVFNVIDGKTFRHTSKHYGVFSIEGSQNVSLFSQNIKKYNTIYKNILKRFPQLSRLIAQRQRQIIISIGYHKSYNDYFIESCKSIINQNMDFKCVIVLTNEQIQELPHNIQEFIQDNGIEIIQTEKDLREYNKYYYPMMKYPYHGVMVFEGNMMYKVGLISKMFSRYLKYPYSVIGCCCHVIKYNSLKGVTPYYSWTFDYKQSITPAYNLIIDPISPAFYPPGCLGFTEKFKDNIEQFFGYEELYLKFIENYRNVAVQSLGLQDFQTYLGRHTLREYKIHLYDDKAFLYKNMQRMVKNTVFNSGFNVDSTQSSNFNDFIKYRQKTRMIL